MTDDITAIRNTIRAERARRNWSQSELGRRSGLTVNIVNNIERGVTHPTVEQLLSIARAMSLDPASLLPRALSAA